MRSHTLSGDEVSALRLEAASCRACAFADETDMDLPPEAHVDACQALDYLGISREEV